MYCAVFARSSADVHAFIIVGCSGEKEEKEGVAFIVLRRGIIITLMFSETMQ